MVQDDESSCDISQWRKQYFPDVYSCWQFARKVHVQVLQLEFSAGVNSLALKQKPNTTDI